MPLVSCLLNILLTPSTVALHLVVGHLPLTRSMQSGA